MEPASEISFHQQHQLSFIGRHHISPDGRLNLVHGHHIGALAALLLRRLGQEGVEHAGHAGDGDHVTVGDHGVRGRATLLGRVPRQVLGVSQRLAPARHLHGPEREQVGNDDVGRLAGDIDKSIVQLLRKVAWWKMI